MKVRTIRVKPGQSIEELVAELTGSTAERLILVSGTAPTVLNQGINLRLLKYYAEEEDKELWIQTNQRQLQILAEQLEIPVLGENDYNSRIVPGEPVPPEGNAAAKAAVEIAAIDMAQPGDAADELEPDLAGPGSLWLRGTRTGGLFIATAVALFALIVAVWWFLQPVVLVTVYPKEEDLRFHAKAEISTVYKDRQLAEGKIPGKLLVKESSVTVRTVTTGRKTVGVSAASGKVTLINYTGNAVVVPRGTVLYGQGNSRFITMQDVLVPQKSAKKLLGIPIGEEYGRAEAGIVAAEKGVAGNQPAKAVHAVAGPLQRAIKVVNLAPTINGADKQIPVVAAADLQKAEAEAKRQMGLTAPDELSSLTNADHLFWPELVQTELLRNVFQPEIGMEGNFLSNRLDYRASVLVVSRVELHKYLTHLLSVRTPADFLPVSDSLQLIDTRVLAQKGPKAASLEIEAKGRIRGVLNPQKLQRLIAGKSLPAAKEALNACNEVAGFQIKLRRPMAYLPKFSFQIRILLPEGTEPR